MSDRKINSFDSKKEFDTKQFISLLTDYVRKLNNNGGSNK